jgi:3',5'-cyclic AMP phosphodiesterase CpdA
VPTRILHISDLHIGTPEVPAVGHSLDALIERVDPAVVVASGDLTHRGRAEQHDRAASFLRGLGRPLLVVPGNHDIPFLPPARMTRTFAEFERVWETAEPVHRSPELLVVGVNSVRPWRHQSGGVSDAQLTRSEQLLGGATENAFRVVVLHHPLTGAPWRSRKRPLARRKHVLERLAEAGAELILAGHIHQSTVTARHEFEVLDNDPRCVTLAIAPGFGRPRPHRQGEARGLQVYEASDDSLRADTYIWSGDEWRLMAERTFPRG